jgi:chitodextrinase
VAGLEGVNAGAAVAVQPDGKIVAVGRYDWTVSRYRTDGSRDPSFTRRTTLFPDYTFATPRALALNPEGKIVVVGDVANWGGPSFFALARYEGGTAANAAPHAQIDHSCTGTACFVHGYGSTDPDGTIAHYKWDFPDGTSSSDAYVRKDLGAYGTHTVRLTVTDNGGATATRELTVTVLQLTAHGSLAGGFPTVQLTWNANPGTLYWVYRGPKKVGIVAGSGIVDRPPVAASGIYSYAVCEASGPMCSASETVKFVPGG